jgi:hypothetical protein
MKRLQNKVAVVYGDGAVGGALALEELTNAAVFAASDEGSAMSGTIFNLTAGMIV